MKTFIISIRKFTFLTCLVFAAINASSQCTVVTPGPVTGIKNVCRYIGTLDQLTYSIDPLVDATSYEWLIPPSNVTLVSGQGTTSMTVTFQNGYATQANKQIRVRAIFPCGISSYRIFYTVAQFPGTPGNIVPSITNVCGLVGTGNTVSYTINIIPSASSYIWTVPANAMIVDHPGGPGSPNDTTITVAFTTGFAGGNISVTAANNCGISGTRSLSIGTTFPATPGPIVAGVPTICTFIGTGNAVSYTTNKVSGASSYNWTVPAGCTVTHPNGIGPNDTTVLISFNAGFIGGLLSVAAVNTCGPGGTRSLYINTANPATPGLINGNTNVCSNISPGGTFATYSIQPVSGATLYNWTAPAGCIVTHPNGAGPNDLTIQVLFPQGFASGNIMVTATNGCGTSGLRILAVNILPPSAPGAITATQISGCPDRVYTYSLASTPLNSTSVEWSVPPGAIIVSGQGTNLITVSFGSNNINGNITAVGVNNCGVSALRTIPVQFFQCRPASAARNSSSIIPEGSATGLQIFPNPSTGDFKVKISAIENTGISIKVLDVLGRTLQTINAKTNETISFGNELKPGSYFIEITQGNTREIQRLVKL